jgi:hypothetical protein
MFICSLLMYVTLEVQHKLGLHYIRVRYIEQDPEEVGDGPGGERGGVIEQEGG